MKRIAAVILVAGCLAGASDAFAEAPPLTVSVEGVANVGISKVANTTEANAAYRQGLSAAIADGLGKAEFLASQTGAKVGAIDQISEEGGSIGCSLQAETGPLSEYVPYEGASPDFGSVTGGNRVFAAAPQAAAKPSHGVATRHKKKKRKHKPKAKKAGVASCTLSTQILLTYAIS